MKTRRSTAACRTVARLALALGALASAAPGGDWPQWRFDANRSGATAEPGPASANRLWAKALPRPEPAYDHQYRMCADVAYAPVAAEGLVFFPSNVSDEVAALDIVTGAVRWRFFAEGPVRFAPVYVAGRVCFGSDDGWFYCVGAKDGALLWKVRGAPEGLPDCRMLVNGRLCSRWPVRGAPVASGGIVYFGAGIWPEEGVYVVAVDAATGKMLWRRDSLSYVHLGMSDHGRAYDLSLPPQGYLAVIDGRLAVPSGRTLAAWFDPRDGTMEPYTCYYVKTNPPRGTWYLAGINRYCIQGGNWFGTRADAAPALPPELRAAASALSGSKDPPANEAWVAKNRPFLNTDTVQLHNENLYTEPVLTESTAYASEFDDEKDYLVPRGHTRVAFAKCDRIVARDLTRPTWTGMEYRNRAIGKKTAATLHRLGFPILWQLDSPLRVLIKAGDRLFAGGENVVAAIAIPPPGGAPRVEWQAAVDGNPVHALVADAKLVVVTDRGAVVCFGDGAAAPGPAPAPATGEPPASPRRGYALALGWGDGAAAPADKGFRVFVIEPDAAKASAARQTLADKGLHGRGAQVLSGNPAMLLTPYWADRVTVAAPEALGSPERTLGLALDAMRPFTGELRIADAAGGDVIRRLLARRSGYVLERDGGDVVVRRKAPPEGAAEWTHEAGGPDNRFASSDALVRWPLGVLWYSGGIDRFFTPETHFQHERNPFPLVTGGRMFLITGRTLHAIDIYTGDYLWRAEMPLTPWVNARFFDSRMYGRPTERHCAAAADWVYAVTGAQIHAYDAATGETRGVIEIPDPLRGEAHSAVHDPQKLKAQGQSGEVQGIPEWTEVRLWNDSLFAMLGRRLVALDRHSGKLRWSRPATRGTTTCAIGGGTLFGLDCDVPAAGRAANTKTPGLLFALDPATGAPLWQKAVDYEPAPKDEPALARPWMPPILPVLAHNAKHGLLVMTARGNAIHVFRASDGAPTWSIPASGGGDLHRIYPPVVTDDHILVSQYKSAFGYLFDIRTGKEAGENTGIPQPRTCARAIGNNSLLVYRDAATELYDIANNRMIGFNSMRSGCTTSYIPAGGVLTAPMLGHGCVCNYPMFASVAFHHMPEIEPLRPAAVVKSWVNQYAQTSAPGASAGADDEDDARPAADAGPVDVAGFQLHNCTLEPAPGGALFRSTGEGPCFAIRPLPAPLKKAVFRVSVRRAEAKAGEKRHGNAFFVFGGGARPDELIECQLYYGGRSSAIIAGAGVERREAKMNLRGSKTFDMAVTVDCAARTVVLETGGERIVSRITGPLEAVTHCGYGGAHADNVFTAIAVQ